MTRKATVGGHQDICFAMMKCKLSKSLRKIGKDWAQFEFLLQQGYLQQAVFYYDKLRNDMMQIPDRNSFLTLKWYVKLRLKNMFRYLHAEAMGYTVACSRRDKSIIFQPPEILQEASQEALQWKKMSRKYCLLRPSLVDFGLDMPKKVKNEQK